MRKIKGKVAGRWLVLLALLFAPGVTPAQTYTNFTTIDEPQAGTGVGGGTYVEGISSNTVVGYYYNGTGRHGFYHALGTTNYTTLDDPLSISSSSTNTAAYGISGRNIVGLYVDEEGSSGQYGFLYNMDSASFYTINDPNGINSGQSSSAAYAIDSDNIVGDLSSIVRPGNSILSFLTTFNPSQPSVYAFTPFYIPIPQQVTVTFTNYVTELTGISGNLVVGAVVDTNNYHLALVYNLTAGTYVFLTNSATGGIVFLNGIEGDVVVGHYSDPAKNFNYSGFVLTLGTTNLIEVADPLGLESTFAQGISGGLVVGYYVDGSGQPHGFVVGTAPIVPPRVDLVQISGNQLKFSITNGIPSAPFNILGTSNLGLPMNQWSVVITNKLDANGSFAGSNAINSAIGGMYFRLKEYP